MDYIGERIKHCRKQLGMTQQELTGKEFTKAYISMIERGQAVPSIKTLLVLAERLRIRPGYFVDL